MSLRVCIHVQSPAELLSHLVLQDNMQDQQSVPNVEVIWRGKKLIVEIDSGATLKDLGHELQRLTNVKADTMKLIVPQLPNKTSRLLSPFSDEHERLSLRETSILEVSYAVVILYPCLQIYDFVSPL